MDLSLAVAQGFHNAPRLYGDTTVRPPPRVSGIQSGLRAAGSEFVFGVYDGVTGLFLQPYHGAQKNGALGFVQGIGKGVGGFVLKDLAAIIGPFGYTLKGVHKEIIKNRQPTAFICKARQSQGGKDARELDSMAKEREMAKVDAAWRIVVEIRKEDEAQMEEGLKGRVAVLKQRRKNDTYETVGHAKRALETKQEERRERENSAAVRTSGEERRGSRMFGMKGSLLKSNGAKGAETAKGNETNGHPKGADREVKSQNLDLGKDKLVVNGQARGGGMPEPGLANGTATAAA